MIGFPAPPQDRVVVERGCTMGRHSFFLVLSAHFAFDALQNRYFFLSLKDSHHFAEIFFRIVPIPILAEAALPQPGAEYSRHVSSGSTGIYVRMPESAARVFHIVMHVIFYQNWPHPVLRPRFHLVHVPVHSRDVRFVHNDLVTRPRHPLFVSARCRLVIGNVAAAGFDGCSRFDSTGSSSHDAFTLFCSSISHAFSANFSGVAGWFGFGFGFGTATDDDDDDDLGPDRCRLLIFPGVTYFFF